MTELINLEKSTIWIRKELFRWIDFFAASFSVLNKSVG